MSSVKFIPPSFGEKAFNCPYCEVLTTQFWSYSRASFYKNSDLNYIATDFTLHISWCMNCNKQCLWLNKKMIVPDSGDMPLPNEDLNEDVKYDYMEAASIFQKSPRAAAALLRIALQKLCKQLGGKGEYIQDDLDMLVDKGFPADVLDAMDSVRIVGNERGAHPGNIDIENDEEAVSMLFNLINFVADVMLTQPRKRAEFRARLPDSKKRKHPNNEPDTAD